jgi:hypothetical protein
MRLMSEREVPQTPRDRVFRASRFNAAIFALGCSGGCAAMVFFRWPPRRAPYYISAVILALLFLLRGYIIPRFHPSNWLVRTGDEGLFIHFRSYLNDQMAAEDSTVIFLPYQEIGSGRRVRENMKTRDMEGAVVTQIRRYVELELAIDPAPLLTALREESSRPGPKQKRWYGSSSTVYRDYPVRMEVPPFLRIEWRAVPRPAVFLDAVRSRFAIAPTIVVSSDFSALDGLPREEQEKKLRELDRRGDTIAAVYLARKLFRLDLAQATDFVDKLRGVTQQ